MSDRLSGKAGWQMARAVKLHEHFNAVATVLERRCGTLTGELEKVARMLDGKQITLPAGGSFFLKASAKTLLRNWYIWEAGGSDGKGNPVPVPADARTARALLLNYKPGCGGHHAMPAKLVQEIQRRLTAPTGGRDKHKKAPITAVYDRLCADFQARRPLPGIDYERYPEGAEFPWHYRTVCDAKPARTLRMAGNVGRVAHKAISAFVSLNYATLRKGELYTLDDVRLDIVVIDEATGRKTEVVCYILMEVASRSIVAYVLKPSRSIKQEDVDELLAYGLQTPGFGIGVGYTTHILFERGTVACSEAAQMVLEGVSEGRIKVHRTSMVGGIRWDGAPADQAKGNAAGKAVIESFNRSLHFRLMHLPGQRGNNFGNAPENLGYDGADQTRKGSLIDEAEKLATFNLAMGGRCKLTLGMLRVMELDAEVSEAIKAHNNETGRAFRGHGKFAEEEVAPGVWVPVTQGKAIATAPAKAKRTYDLRRDPAEEVSLTPAQQTAIYFGEWKKVEAVKPSLDRYAITRRAIGRICRPGDMTPAEFAKVLSVFRAIARDATPAAGGSNPF